MTSKIEHRHDPAAGEDSLHVVLDDAAVLLFAIGAFAPQHLANDFLLRLADRGLLLGILALSIAFLMSQAGLVSLGAASVYGGVGYLFAIATSLWNLSPLAAII